MELVIKTDRERFLRLKSKTLTLNWCKTHNVFEGFCELEDLKGENGKGLPPGVTIALVRSGMDGYTFCDQPGIHKYDPNHEKPICVQHGIVWEAKEHQVFRKELYQRIVIERDKQIIKKLRRFYFFADVQSDCLNFGRLISSDLDLYQVILEDFEFNQKFFRKNFKSARDINNKTS